MPEDRVMKIKQPNSSEIEVQLQPSKKKLTYIKNLEEPGHQKHVAKKPI